MSDEAAFLNALLADPADDTTRLVYADWLDETGDPAAAARAEFLRLTAERSGATASRQKAIDSRLRGMAARFDPGWLAAVSKLPVENCPAGGTAVGSRRRLETIEFAYECPRQWENLRPTDDAAVRFCEACAQNVYYCETISAARDHVEIGHCVAVDARLARRRGDLNPPVFRRVGIIMSDIFDPVDPDPGPPPREKGNRGEEANCARRRAGGFTRILLAGRAGVDYSHR